MNSFYYRADMVFHLKCIHIGRDRGGLAGVTVDAPWSVSIIV